VVRETQPGAPRRSDVCFSIRWMRSDIDPFEMIRRFHGTRFDWVYADAGFIKQCKQRGYPTCHSTSAARPDVGGADGGANSYKIGRAVDIRGEPLTASWQNWSPPWRCVSNPDFLDLLFHDVAQVPVCVQQFNDLYAFVRANARWLDGYQYAAGAGRGIRDQWCGDRPLAAVEGNDNAYAFVRAAPGDLKAPAVVHLIDWGQEAASFTLVLDPSRFFPGGSLEFELLVPAQHPAADHEAAERSRDFAKFSRTAPVHAEPTGGKVRLDIPKLNPWAMLVVRRAG
jgi:hypothetical protein